MIQFLKFPNSQNKVDGRDDLFNQGYGNIRYAMGHVTALDTDNLQFTKKKDADGNLLPEEDQTAFYRGTINIEGDVRPRTLVVWANMLKDVQVGADVITKIGATAQPDGSAIMSFQFSYGEGGSQNVVSASEVQDIFGLSITPAQSVAKQANPVG